jgi:hypothetical protein
MNNVIDRINELNQETTKDLIDGAFMAQQQNAQLVQSWFNILNANQQATRNLGVKLVQQAQEAQNLWLKLGQEMVRANTEAATQVSQAGFQNMNQTINNVSRQTQNASQATENNTGKTGATATK